MIWFHMKLIKPRIPAQHRPHGFDILHEDEDIIVVNKEAGVLTVAALWNKDETVHAGLNHYVRKGQARSKKEVFTVHRLDQATTGVLIFAKTEAVMNKLKNEWHQNTKVYYTVVKGAPKKKKDLIESYLSEDEDYHVHSSADHEKGKLARTEYEVVGEKNGYSLIRVNLLTGKKNQIRVHMAELGCPIVGDVKYGQKKTSQTAKSDRGGQASQHTKTQNKYKASPLLLHAYSLELTHPFKKVRARFTADFPAYFSKYFDLKKILNDRSE